MTKPKFDFDHTTGDGQKRLMAISRGLPQEIYTKPGPLPTNNDYGCDPVENGMFRMVPSGDIVDYKERCERLKKDRVYLIDEKGEAIE